MTPDAAADGFSRLALGKFFSLMAALHTHVFMLNFVDFPVSEQQRLRNGAACRVGL